MKKNHKVKRDKKRGLDSRYYSLRDGRASLIKDDCDDGKYVNSVYTDGYNSYERGRSHIRNAGRKQKFRKAPYSSIMKYGCNKEIFDAFEVDVNKCVIINGCYSTNKQVLKKQLVPENLSGDFYKYPTVENLLKFDDTVRAVFRKLKFLGIIERQKFSDIMNTEVSPLKKPGFRYEEEFGYTTKKEAIRPAFRLSRKRWNVANNKNISYLKKNNIFSGVYTIGARNKRDYTYDDGEAASSRVVHMPELHCELTSSPWCDAFIDRIKELATGPIYLGNSILDWFRLDRDISDSHYVIEGDWKRFDSTLYIKIITIALCIFRCFYPHRDPYVDKHFLLMYDTLAIKDYYLPGGRIVRAYHGLPSGVKATSLLGSIINLIALIYCINPKNSKCFNFIVGGDDFLISARTDGILWEEICDQMEEKSRELGMTFKYLKKKNYESEEVENCPSFYKYTIYKGFPTVPTSSVLERVFMPWNKIYNTDTKVLKFLRDVMPSLGKPMSHHLLYYDYLSSILSSKSQMSK